MSRGGRQTAAAAAAQTVRGEVGVASSGPATRVPVPDALQRYRALEIQLCAQLMERDEIVRAAMMGFFA